MTQEATPLKKKPAPQIEEPDPEDPTYLDGYDSNALSPADIAGLTRATILDFAVGLIYQSTRQVGMKDMDPETPRFQPRYELVDHEVFAETINQDLLDFQQFIKKNDAYLP